MRPLLRLDASSLWPLLRNYSLRKVKSARMGIRFFSQLDFRALKFFAEKEHQLQISRFHTCMRHVVDEFKQFREILSFSSLSKSLPLKSFKEYQELPRTDEQEGNIFECNCLL